jgi:hypothetical protein
MTSRELFDEIAKAFRANKMPDKKTRETFLTSYKTIESGQARGLDDAFGRLLPKGKQTTRSKNLPSKQHDCVMKIADLLNSNRDCSVDAALKQVNSESQVGIGTLKEWWSSSYVVPNPETAKDKEILLWFNVRRAKNRWKKTEWEKQPVRKVIGQDGIPVIELSSLQLLPKKKKPV